MIRFFLLAFLALVQLGCVGWMIARREIILATGTEMKFVVAPADPYDPFSGRYVRLRFEADTFQGRPESGIEYRRIAYAVLNVDAEGYATVTTLCRERPAEEVPYLKVDLHYPHTVHTEGKPDYFDSYINIPFDRYYMNEEAAPEAERLYAEAHRERRVFGPQRDAPMDRANYLVVRVRNGTGVPVELYLNGKTVESQLSGAK